MNIADKITDLVGNTPLLRIKSLSEESGANILAKLECANPLSSVKDRIAKAMIETAEASGDLKKDSIIIEPTSGNTGIGLAFVAASKGYKCILTMPDTMSIERRKLLKALGADVVLTPGDKGMKGAIAKAEEILAETPTGFMPQQFKNPANPKVHQETTAKEIWLDTDGKVDVFVAGVGTGGTITGVGTFLKNKSPHIQIVAVEPDESAILSGEAPGKHKIQGIGAGFVPDILNIKLIDEIIRIKSEDAGAMTRRLAKTEGILVGISAGANVAAAMQVASRPGNRGKNIITVLCDTGERYLSTWVFED